MHCEDYASHCELQSALAKLGGEFAGRKLLAVDGEASAVGARVDGRVASVRINLLLNVAPYEPVLTGCRTAWFANRVACTSPTLYATRWSPTSPSTGWCTTTIGTRTDAHLYTVPRTHRPARQCRQACRHHPCRLLHRRRAVVARALPYRSHLLDLSTRPQMRQVPSAFRE